MKADTLPTVGVLASAARRRKWSVLDGMVTAPTANLLFVSVMGFTTFIVYELPVSTILENARLSPLPEIVSVEVIPALSAPMELICGVASIPESAIAMPAMNNARAITSIPTFFKLFLLSFMLIISASPQTGIESVINSFNLLLL